MIMVNVVKENANVALNANVMKNVKVTVTNKLIIKIEIKK